MTSVARSAVPSAQLQVVSGLNASAAAASSCGDSNFSGLFMEERDLYADCPDIEMRDLKAELSCIKAGKLMSALKKVSLMKEVFRESFLVSVNILSFLSAEDVFKATSDLPEGYKKYEIDDLLGYVPLPVTHSRFRVINEKVWRKCFGDEALSAQELSFGKAPSLQSLNALRASVRSLNELASIPVEGDVGFTLLTLPEVLTLNKLIALAAAFQLSHQSAGIRYIDNSIKNQHGDILVTGGLVAISNGLLIGSRNKSVAVQSELIKSHGCQMPRMVEALALCFLTYFNSSTIEAGPVRLLNNAPWRYTRSIEQIAGKPYHLFVGGFTPAGLIVYNGNFFDRYSCGVCVLREFPAIGH